jgi:hypothetical protein
MKRYIAAIAVWAAAAALFAAINVQAKPGDIVTPDVVGMTVAEAVQAWADAGFTQVPNVNPGNLDPATVPDAIVVKQTPKAGVTQSANYRGVFFIDAAEPTPTPSPTPTSTDEPSPTPTPTDTGSPTPSPTPSATGSPTPAPTEPPSSTRPAGGGSLPRGEVEGAEESWSGGGDGGDPAGDGGSLSFTL